MKKEIRNQKKPRQTVGYNLIKARNTLQGKIINNM